MISCLINSITKLNIKSVVYLVTSCEGKQRKIALAKSVTNSVTGTPIHATFIISASALSCSFTSVFQ